jgi:hypothetical protein
VCHGYCASGGVCSWDYPAQFADADRQTDERLLTFRLPRTLEVEDVISLLRAELRRAGSVAAWCKKTGVHRTIVSKVLNNARPPTKSVIEALKLRTVFAVRDDKPKRPTRRR